MRPYLLVILILLVFVPQVVSTEITRLPSNYIVSFELPNERWQVSDDAPDLAEMQKIIQSIKLTPP